jgi:hypothetical protein
VPQAFDRRLVIARPLLPDFIESVDVRHLRVGDACVGLHFKRDSDGMVAVDVRKIERHLDVEVEKAPSGSAGHAQASVRPPPTLKTRELATASVRTSIARRDD